MYFKNSNRNFGFIFSFLFFILAIFKIYNGDISKLLFVLSFIFFILAIFKPIYLSFPNRLWIKLGILLGKVISPIVMYFVYFLAIYPVSLILKLFKKEIIGIKFDSNKKSYWSKIIHKEGSMNDQF